MVDGMGEYRWELRMSSASVKENNARALDRERVERVTEGGRPEARQVDPWVNVASAAKLWEKIVEMVVLRFAV